MKNTETEEKKQVRDKSTLDRLALASRGKFLTIRDDQYDFATLRDLTRAWRRLNRRFRLIDSGKIGIHELEWLGEAGADVYTSSGARNRAEELELIQMASRRGRAITAFLLKRSLIDEEAEDINFSDFLNLAADGVYFYISNRKIRHDFLKLNELASTCRKGGSFLVYYHHGPVEHELEALVRSGAWIHVSDRLLEEAEERVSLVEFIGSISEKRPHFIVHIEKKWEFLPLQDMLSTGVYVLYHTALSDYKSPLRPLEKRAEKRKLDFRTYYLYPDFLV